MRFPPFEEDAVLVKRAHRLVPPPADVPDLPVAKASAVGSEIGVTGLRYWSFGRIDEEFLRELKWDQARKIYREMGDNDPTVGAALNTVSWIIRSVDWRFESDLGDTDARVDLLESAKDDMSHSWRELISEIVRGTLQYGWQFHEVVYKKRDDGLIGWKKMPIRSQDSLWKWEFNPDGKGDVVAMTQQAPPDYQTLTIPIEKGLLFRTESVKNSPEGRSILRSAYRPWYFKKNIENIEGIGIERDLAGLPVMYAPAAWFTDADTSKLDAMKLIATNVKRDEQEGMVLPSIFDDKGNRLVDFKLLTTGGTRQFNTTDVINRYDLRILQLMLADFIQLGHEKVGSFALSSDKTDIFAVAISVFLDMIASVFNQFAIPRLLELNGMDTEDAPELVHSDLENQNLAELADFLSKLAAAGMAVFPNPKIEAKLLEAANLPVPTPEEAAARDAQIAQDAASQLATRLAQQPPDQPGQPVTPAPFAQPSRVPRSGTPTGQFPVP